MFELNLKWKGLLFCISSIPLLVIVLLLYYAPMIPIDSWFFNDGFLRTWLYIIFLVFVPFQLLQIIVSEKIGILEKTLLFFAFLFLVFDMMQYALAGIDLDQVIITIILAIILNFSLPLRENSTIRLLSKNEWIFYIILIIIILIIFFRPPMLEYLSNIYYVYQAISYILLSSFIVVYLLKNRKDKKIKKNNKK